MVKTIYILVVDDNELMALTLQEGLKHLFSNCQVAIATSGQEALQILIKDAFDLLVINYQMPHMNGLTLANQARQMYPDLPVMIISAFSSFRLRHVAASLAIDHVLIKPVGLLQIREAVLDLLGDRINLGEVKDRLQISAALEDWISQQAAHSRPDLRTREVMELLGQWNNGL